jgi:3-dehydroquinate dehydratase type I
VHIKYCRPLVKSNKKVVADEIERTANLYEYFEVWLDYVDSVDDAFITELINNYPNKLIFNFRRLMLEPTRMPLEQRLHILHALSGQPAYVDLDVSSQREEYTSIDSENVDLKLIGSYHNYQETPGNKQLSEIVAEISVHQPDIIKLSTFCQDEVDALRLMAMLLQLRSQGRKVIVLGMGNNGSVTRVFGTQWGNELVFAPEETDEQTAPGQYTRRQLDVIFQNLSL